MRYISLVKPGILMGNCITLVGGYFFALHGQFHIIQLLSALLGMSLVIASGCVFNNFIDRDIDALMERTKRRVSVQGLVSLRSAMLFATVMGLLGAAILWFAVNAMACVAALVGFFVYVVAYSLWFKRHSVWGTAIGGIAGAMPPVVGYLAVSSQFDLGALLVFAILFCWQIPHSYAIAIYRLDDYRAAAIPVLPLQCGLASTKRWMLVFVVAFAVVSLLPWFVGLASWLYGLVSLAVGLTWLWYSIQGFSAVNDARWARKMFVVSIIAINLICLGFIIG